MVGIFFLFLVVQVLIFFEKRKIALIIFLICMGLTADRYPQVPFSGGNR